MAQQTQPQRDKKSGVFSQVSFPAVLAAALASVTSFLFSSKLGLTGSLIGAAIAAAVSTIASQIYNGMIRASMERLQDMGEHVQTLRDEAGGTRDMSMLDKTVAGKHAGGAPYGGDETVSATGTRIAPSVLREEAAHRRLTNAMRRSFIVAIVAALIALAAYAIVVNVATQGQGIGPTSFEEIGPVTESASDQTGSDASSATSDQNGQQASTDAATTTQTTDAAGGAQSDTSSETTGKQTGAGSSASSNDGSSSTSTSSSGAASSDTSASGSTSASGGEATESTGSADSGTSDASTEGGDATAEGTAS